MWDSKETTTLGPRGYQAIELSNFSFAAHGHRSTVYM